MQIAGFDVDDKADGSGKAPITWIGRELLRSEKAFNTKLVTNADGTFKDGTGMIGGWGNSSSTRMHLKNTIKPLMPDSVRGAIKDVTKTQYAYNISGDWFTQTTQDDIWIPSSREITENTYLELFTCNVIRSKKKPGATSYIVWHLRDAKYAKGNYYVTTSGKLPISVYSGGTDSLRGICICFCT